MSDSPTYAFGGLLRPPITVLHVFLFLFDLFFLLFPNFSRNMSTNMILREQNDEVVLYCYGTDADQVDRFADALL